MKQSITTKLREEWKNYGLKTENVFFNGKQTKFQAISKNGKLAAFMTDFYQVLPNEDVIKVADQIAEKLKAKGYIPRAKKSWFKPEGHVLHNETKTQMNASYMFPDKVDISGGGDTVQYGFHVRNSIDGSCGFSVGATTVRQACDNIMYHLASEQKLGWGVGALWSKPSLKQTEVLKNQHEKIKAARVDLNEMQFKRIHTKALTLEFVEEKIHEMEKASKIVLKRYKEMYDLKLLQKQAEALFRRMPKTVTNELSWLNYDKKSGDITIKGEPTQWEAFNDITNALTFEQRAYRASMESYKSLDQILVRSQ